MKNIRTIGKFRQAILMIALPLLLGGKAYAQAESELPQLGKSSVKEVIDAMTLEEKASMVVGAGLNISPSVAHILEESMKKMIPEKGSLASQSKSPVPPAAGNTIEIPRLGIPCIVVNDGPAGLRMMGGKYECTAFPIGTSLASTWNKDLIFETGKSFGNDVLEYGVDILLAPGMNIQRDPLCGRNFEYYSEDPFLSGKVGAAMVKGIQSQGVGTSIKHFVANNQETDRTSVNTVVSERALREIYLEGFRIAVQEADPWTIMSSYNLVNGVYTSESPDLLINVLRDDWGYRGCVTTDWNGGKNFTAQVKAGNDLLMPGPYQVNTIIQAVKDGELDENLLDRNIENILELILRTPRFKKYQYSNTPNATENAKISRMAATEGMVLLKNENNTLPFSKQVKSIALFGNASYDTYIGGSGSGYVATTYKVHIYEGLKNSGYQIDDALEITYKDYMKENVPKQTDMVAAMMGGATKAPEMSIDPDLANKMAAMLDMAVYTIGRNSGESKDRKIDDDFNLSDIERSNLNLITEAFHAKGKKVVVILNIGGVIETASWRDNPDAILLAWQPGIEAGNAIADLISGKVNPSGKLAITFPITYSDVPSAKNFPGVEVKGDSIIKRKVVYEEGIYVGYRYYNTFNVNTVYEFGYGLSYTNFAYNNLELSSHKFKDQLKVTVEVKNSGKVAGKEIVQLYLSAPASKIDKPVSELKGFMKTKLLQPGESQTLTFVLDSRSLASFYSSSSAWIADAGKYTVKVGASVKSIKQSGSFTLKKDLLVKKVNKALVPNEEINEISPKK